MGRIRFLQPANTGVSNQLSEAPLPQCDCSNESGKRLDIIWAFWIKESHRDIINSSSIVQSPEGSFDKSELDNLYQLVNTGLSVACAGCFRGLTRPGHCCSNCGFYY